MSYLEESEGFCPEHGWQHPQTEFAGGKIYWTCPICRDYLLDSDPSLNKDVVGDGDGE